MSFSRNLKGECEEDNELPRYDTVEECMADNQALVFPSQFDRYVAIEAATYNDEDFFYLAPSDRAEYLKIRYGVVVDPDDSYRIGRAIMVNDYAQLYYRFSEQAMPYLQTKLEEYDFFLLDLIRPIRGVILGRCNIFNLAQFRLWLHEQFMFRYTDQYEPFMIYDDLTENLNLQGIITPASLDNTMIQRISERLAVFDAKYRR